MVNQIHVHLWQNLVLKLGWPWALKNVVLQQYLNSDLRMNLVLVVELLDVVEMVVWFPAASPSPPLPFPFQLFHTVLSCNNYKDLVVSQNLE